MTLKQAISLFISLFLIYGYYFSSSGGINTSNDGGHFGLASSMYFDHQLSVGKYLDTYVRWPDYAVKDSVIYSDRLPGTALTLIPFLAYYDLFRTLGYTPDMNRAIGITHPDGTPNPTMLAAILLPNLCGVISVLLLFLFCFRLFGFSFQTSLITTWVGALCTLIHLESTHVFSHALSMMWVTLAVFLSIRYAGSGPRKKNLMVISAIFGFATIVELQNALLFVPVFFYVMHKNVGGVRENIQAYVAEGFKAAGIIGLFLLVLLTYNFLAFDDLMLKSNKYNPFFPEERSFLTALSGNVLEGLDRLLTGFGNYESYLDWTKGVNNGTTGIVNANPVFIFSIVGFIPFYKKRRSECLMFLALIFISILIAALHVTTLIRHISTIYVLMFLPFVYSMESLAKLKKPWAYMAFVAVAAVVGLSFIKQMYLTHHYWGKGHLSYFPYEPYLGAFLVYNAPLMVATVLFLTRWKERIVPVK